MPKLPPPWPTSKAFPPPAGVMYPTELPAHSMYQMLPFLSSASAVGWALLSAILKKVTFPVGLILPMPLKSVPNQTAPEARVPVSAGTDWSGLTLVASSMITPVVVILPTQFVSNSVNHVTE